MFRRPPISTLTDTLFPDTTPFRSVAHSSKGIQVDTRLRSSNRRIDAIGDVAVVDGLGGFQFTHLAGYHAGIVVRNALFKLPARVDYRALPRVTFTDSSEERPAGEASVSACSSRWSSSY